MKKNFDVELVWGNIFLNFVLYKPFLDLNVENDAMDRRQFCKIGALALGAFGLGGVDVLASSATQFSGRNTLPAPCRITVLRRECFDDLQALYLDDPDEGPCSSFKEGDTWLFETGAVCPTGFCPRVWDVILKCVG
ncbi:MAG: hypothetical protein K2K92_08070, partial [Duncaniella sp.]|nr:hypothetical protein [Duncaniella sp.]